MVNSYLIERRFVINVIFNKKLICFTVLTNFKDTDFLKAALFDFKSEYPEAFLDVLRRLHPEYTFSIDYDPKLFYSLYEALKPVFLQVYNVYVDHGTKLWGIGSEEQDDIMSSTLNSMFPFLPERFYKKALKLQPGTFSSLVHFIHNYQLSN